MQNYEIIQNKWIRQRFDTHYRAIKISEICFIEAAYPSLEGVGSICLLAQSGVALHFLYKYNTEGEEEYDADLAFFENLIFNRN